MPDSRKLSPATTMCHRSLRASLWSLPGLREIQSGSKIIVNYDNSVPAEMQGAFEYAVKIWEEVLPMTLPIKIDVKAENIRGASDLLSKVSFPTNEYNGYPERDISLQILTGS